MKGLTRDCLRRAAHSAQRARSDTWRQTCAIDLIRHTQDHRFIASPTHAAAEAIQSSAPAHLESTLTVFKRPATIPRFPPYTFLTRAVRQTPAGAAPTPTRDRGYGARNIRSSERHVTYARSSSTRNDQTTLHLKLCNGRKRSISHNLELQDITQQSLNL